MKSIWKSRTFWLGAAIAGLGGFQQFLAENSATDPIILMISGILVIIIRKITTEPVKF